MATSLNPIKSFPYQNTEANFRMLTDCLAEAGWNLKGKDNVPKLIRNLPLEYRVVTASVKIGSLMLFESSKVQTLMRWDKEPGTQVLLLTVLEGAISISFREHLFTLKSGEVLCFDPANYFSLTVKERAKTVWLIIPSDYMKAHLFINSMGFLNIPINCSDSSSGKIFLDTAASVFSNLQELEGVSPTLVALSCLLRPALTSEVLTAKPQETNKDFLRRCTFEVLRGMVGKSGATVQDVADKVGVSARYLAMLFSESGKSVMEELWQMRLERAALWLRENEFKDMPVGEIARKNGFASVSHFSKLFKERFHVTPREWKCSEETKSQAAVEDKG